jgi:hypothetical protein
LANDGTGYSVYGGEQTFHFSPRNKVLDGTGFFVGVDLMVRQIRGGINQGCSFQLFILNRDE